MTVNRQASLLERLVSFDPLVDAASSVVFRIGFGAMMAHWAWDYLQSDRVGHMYVRPQFHFTYYLFDWVQPWNGNGMYLHFFALCLLAIAIGIGLFYRVASSLFAVGFIYVFLLDRTNYQNHYYLIALVSACLPFLPLHRYFSIDAWRNNWHEAWVIPNWSLFLIRFHVALPYVFGGIAKFDSDWLLGVPMQQMLESKRDMPIVGPLISGPQMGMLFAWGGLLFDLMIVPLLLWPRTRYFAYATAVGFHVMNSALFDIHVFPWFMIVVSTIFFAPNWPRQLLTRRERAGDLSDQGMTSGSKWPIDPPAPVNPAKAGGFRPLPAWARNWLVMYCLFQCLWPLRHQLYAGNPNWTERGHHFAWRMMLRGKKVVLGYAVRDVVTGKISNGDAKKFLNGEQAEKFGKDPEMILHMAHYLAGDYKQRTGHAAEVYALVYTSLNGRRPELMIDPNVDLVAEPRGWYQRSWILPQREPLRKPAWDVPPEKWREHLEIPPLNFMQPNAKSSLSDS